MDAHETWIWASKYSKAYARMKGLADRMTCEGCGPRCPSCGGQMDELETGTVACEDCSVVVVKVLNKMIAEQERDAKRQADS